MRKLNVLFITNWYPHREIPTDGIFVREHAKALQLYDDVRVLHQARARADLERRWQLEKEHDTTFTEGIPTYRARARRSAVPKLTGWRVFRAMEKAFGKIVADGFRPDIIHAHVFQTGVLATRLGRKYDIPVCITEHFTAFPRKTLRGLNVLKAKLAFKRADLVMPVSESLQRGIEDYGIKANFRVLPNAVDTSLFLPPTERPSGRQAKRMLIVCHLKNSFKKGIPVLLEALREIDAKRQDWHLDIIGAGPDQAGYETTAEQYGIRERITFHGYQPKTYIAETMRESDFFVLPSLWENLPCVIIEAMAAGLPILASVTGGIPEMVDDSRGRLVPINDMPALRDAIDYMLDHCGDFDSHAISRYAKGRFSYESVGRELHQAYLDILAQRGKLDALTSEGS